jgi:large subunit ribosomal protein L25
MDLTVSSREQFGKAVNILRKQGLIPAELYGHGISNTHLSVDAGEFKKIWKEAGENTIINLIIGSERRSVLIHDVQKDYLSGDPSHIDFYQVRMDEKIKARVPIEFIGEAPAVKSLGGILNKTMSEIEVEALPGDLPHSFSVDLSSLVEFNQSIYAKDLKIPEEVQVLVEPQTVIATVTPPQKEEVAPPPAPEVSEVKVETEEKKAEREKEKQIDNEKTQM